MAKKNRLTPSANSGQAPETPRTEEQSPAVRSSAKSSVSTLSSQTPLARRRAQAEATRISDREPGTVRRSAGRQVFKVSENGSGSGPKEKRKKKKAPGRGSKRNLAPTVVTDDISEEQIRRLKRAEERKRRRRAAIIRSNHIGTRILMALITYAVLTGGIFAALFFYFIPKNDSGQTNNYSYQFGPDVGYTLRRTVSWDVARYNDRLYVDMTGIADFCGLAVTGDGTNMRFIIKSSGQYMEFTPGTSEVNVNGSRLAMGSACRVIGKRVYVPYDFAEKIIKGIAVSYNERRHRITTELVEGQPVSFPLGVVTETPAIAFDALDPDLQRELNEKYISYIEWYAAGQTQTG